MSDRSSGWSGDMLDQPEMVEAWSRQLRASLAEYVDHVARMRRDAEAMWAANPPQEYGSFEAWWRHHKVTAPFAKLQEHLEEAVKLTFVVAAQHRRQRHELPAERQARREAAELERAAAQPRMLRGGGQPYPARKRSGADEESGGSFMDHLARDRPA
ncbi:hypothetical protein ABZW11_26765 [Nonomuraea sp. NPDC004580]|uniref:hypothetical protein n=1 Tax=Nonomuraea sp. NPDC004580 TaxID=3154552 RepID=UPI0033BB6C9A